MRKTAEAALFMASQPMTLDELSKIMDAPNLAEALREVEALAEDYRKRDSSIEVIRTSDNRYHMRLKPEYVGKVSHLAIAPDFTKAQLRTLGLIAVKQPVRQSLVVRIIGNKAYAYISELSEKGFIDAKKSGSTKLLSVTPLFEEYFGGNAETIKKSAAAQQRLA